MVVKPQSSKAGDSCLQHPVTLKVHFVHRLDQDKLACGRLKMQSHKELSFFDAMLKDSMFRCKDCFGVTGKTGRGSPATTVGDLLEQCGDVVLYDEAGRPRGRVSGEPIEMDRAESGEDAGDSGSSAGLPTP